MKINRWLEEANTRPGRFFVANFWFYAIGHVVLMGALAHAIITRGKHLWIVFCMLAALLPMFAWTTYRSIKRMLSGKPKDEVWDESVPALIVMAVAAALYYFINSY